LFDGNASLGNPAHLKRYNHGEAGASSTLCAVAIGSHRTLLYCHGASFSLNFAELLDDSRLADHRSVRGFTWK
jgi:hypothetical protein